MFLIARGLERKWLAQVSINEGRAPHNLLQLRGHYPTFGLSTPAPGSEPTLEQAQHGALLIGQARPTGSSSPTFNRWK
jgi:hypothetical protein